MNRHLTPVDQSRAQHYIQRFNRRERQASIRSKANSSYDGENQRDIPRSQRQDYRAWQPCKPRSKARLAGSMLLGCGLFMTLTVCLVEDRVYKLVHLRAWKLLGC